MKTKREYQIHWATHQQVIPASPEEQVIYELIAEQANDANSSKFRENITKWMVGLSESHHKHGYDDDVFAIEVKPQNYTGTTKLGGGGNFNDLTWRRHNKYLHDDALILQSGFHFGKLLYIVAFPYASIAPALELRLQNILPQGDVPKIYDRWGTFKISDWRNAPYTVKYLTPMISQYRDALTSSFHDVLMMGEYDATGVQGTPVRVNLDVLS